MTTVLRPNFEDPFNTAEDMVKNNITMLGNPLYQYRQTDILAEAYQSCIAQKRAETYQSDRTWDDILPEANQSCIALKKLAETYHSDLTWTEYYKNYENLIHIKGTHAIIERYLTPEDLDYRIENEKVRWWRSKGSIPGPYPYDGWITRRNWYLNEVIFAIISFLFMNTALNLLF